MSQNNPLHPSQLSNLAEEQEFSSYLRQRLYNSKSSRVPKSKRRFVIEARERKRQKLDDEVKKYNEERTTRDIPPAGTVNFDRGNLSSGSNAEHPSSNIAKRSKFSNVSLKSQTSNQSLPPMPKDKNSMSTTPRETTSKSPFWFIEKIKKNPSSMEFVYLNKKKEQGAEPFNPYNLEIVPHSKINKDNYYTMSSKGVTHFQNGQASYVSLDKWIQEHDNYQKILDLTFFKQYRTWKSFYFMKKHVINKRTRKAKKVLTGHLFHLSPILREPLMKVRRLCLNMQRLELFHDQHKTFELDEFMDLQKKRKEEVHEQLVEIIEQITEVVADACQKSMVAAGFGDRFQDIGDVSQFDNQLSSLDSKNSPFQNNDEPYQMSYTEKSQKRRECKKLVSFVRLVDYLIVDSLMVLNYQSVQNILNKVTLLTENAEDVDDSMSVEPETGDEGDNFSGQNFETSEDDHSPLFRTVVKLNVRQMLHVTPDREEFDKNLDHFIKGFLKAIKTERLLHKKEFNEYVEPLVQDQGEDVKIGDGPRVEKIITVDESYNELTKHIRSTLYLSCDRVLDYMSNFENLRKIYLENEDVDMDSIREKNPSLEWFRQEIEKYKTQIDLVRKMATSKNLGMFLVDSKELKDLFTPSPKRCLNAIYSFLPVMAREKNDSLFEKLKNCVTKLQTPPSSVEDFVQYLSDMKQIAEDLPSLEERFDHVQDIYKLLEDEKVEVPPDDKENFTVKTVSKITTLRAALQLAEDSREDRIQKFTVDVERKFVILRDKVKETHEKAKDDLISDESADPAEVITFINDLKENIDQIKARSKQLSQFQDLFGAAPDEIDDLEEVSEDIELKLKLWVSLRDFSDLNSEWKDTVFRDIELDTVKQKVESCSFACMQVEKGLPDNPVTGRLSEQVDEWKSILPVITDLKNPFFQGRHWQKLDNIIGQSLFIKMNQPPTNPDDPNENQFDLGTLINLDIVKKKEEIEEVSQEASQEHSLLELAGTVESHWESMEFEISVHKEMFIIGDTEEIVTQLEDDIITISTILSSSYVTAIKQQVEKWEHDLRLMYDTIEQWVKCQQKWIYLENVFSAPDIASQLEEENKLFKTVNRFFKDTMKRTNENRNVHSACTQNIGLFEKFKNHNLHLAKIEKALEAYLERKRNDFPRMYFLSNDDLLDILSQTENPNVVQPHLEKMFDNIKSLEIDDGNIRSMCSSEGERVPFYRSTLKVGYGNVEGWLTEVEDAMFETVKRLIKQAIKDYSVQDRSVWIKEHFCQVVLTVNQIFWSREVTKCLSSDQPVKALAEFYEISKSNLNYLAQMARGKLSKLERKVVTTLIIIDVHARDVVEEMLEAKVSSPSDFGWLKQLRYEWDKEEDECVVKQTNSAFKYGYEYLGCKSRLVITPLTDRIYMTLTGALHLNMGGSPAGPAGTGKTETVKDLAKALAVQCIVYNCSDGVTYKMMYKFFSGIVQTGAWACFDEFNRINIEVLSVIASQLQTIQSALRAKVNRFEFEEGKEIALRHSCGVFITMNPGYAGRTELPDNLKALFRPVACMVPDYGLIAQVVLYSEGYEDAKSLSKKMVQLYKLSNEQLSAQDHYDFGMRAMKSVLVMAGELKRSNPDNPEDLTLMKAMKDSNIPKFVGEDVNLFEGIVSDLFPNVEEKVIINDTLMKGINEILKRRNLQAVDDFVRKVVQLYDTTVVRHGVMLVGPTGSGKSTNRMLLADALTFLRKEEGEEHPTFQNIRQYTLNPKCITYGQLYGVFNLMTQEWFDGLIPHFARKAVKDESDDRKWMIFDGPVDTLWIESMNSVLDDSKLLCLDNTERIQLNDKINFLFEVEDLAEASPATVSRCGMVYMDPNELGWEPYVDSWVAQHPKEFPKSYVSRLFKTHLNPLLKYVREECEEYLKSVDLNLATSLCDLFMAAVKFHKITFSEPEIDEEGEEQLDQEDEQMVNFLFTFSAIWSVGANLKDDFRANFERFFRDQLGRVCTIPTFGSIYDFTIDFNNLAWVQWEEPEFVYDPKVPFFEIMVPTVDTVRYGYFLQLLALAEKPVLFNGVSGVGKSAIINNTLSEKKESLGLEEVGIQFSAQTSAGRTQKMIELKLVHRKNILKAPPGKKVVLFIDDMNMPQLEEFGAQPPVELIRQLIGYRGFYDVEDRENFTWKRVQDVTVIAACGPPGGGRNPMSARTKRLFHLFNIPNLSDESKTRIFSCILNGFLDQGFSDDVKGISRPLVRASIDMYNRICQDFRPTPSCAHYTFNLRDLSKVFQGILQASTESVRKSRTMVKLWLHENMRCFYDRLNAHKDREMFKDLSVELIQRHFKGNTWDREALFGKEPVLFTRIMKTDPQARVYEEVTNQNKLPMILDDYLGQYNIGSQLKMDLVFFPDAAHHTCKISRVLTQERGNALLVGVGGVGKQSLTRIASSIVGYELFEIKLKRGYGLNDFREDLREVFTLAGVEGKQVVFLFSDFQIVEEAFLEDINNILNSGEVPNLFPPEDREKVINDVRGDAQAAGAESREAIYRYFINRVRDNLHIVLCMSPVGDAFRTRCRMFPSLVNCCTIDWFDEWPSEALEAVAERKFLRVKTGNEDVKQSLIQMCPVVHHSVCEYVEKFDKELGRRLYVTPASYLQFIKFYQKLLEEKTSELNVSRSKLKKGLSILQKTNDDVAVMKKELEELQPVLKEQTEKTEKILKEVSAGTKEANAKRVVISEEEKVVSEKTKKAEALAKESEDRLAEALPALQKAQKALEGINKGDIAEIKRYTNPPDAVAVVLNAVQVLYGNKKPDWENGVKLMSSGGFVNNCIEFDKENIPEKVISTLKKKYIPHPLFDEDVVRKKSGAAASLCIWVRAMVKFYDVNKDVIPLKEALKSSRAELDKMAKVLKEKQAELKKVEDQVADLNAKYDKNMKELKDLESRTATAERRLKAAEKLTGSLADEHERWSESIGNFDEQLVSLPGNMFFAAACVVYIGPFTSEFRAELTQHWESKMKELDIPLSDDCSLVKILGDQVKVRDWNIAGLPTDKQSIENAIIATSTDRWPLMIDPQGQATGWISNMEKSSGLKPIQMSTPNYLRTIDNAIRIGTPVLMENLPERIDPPLDPLLQKEIFKKQGRLVIQMGSSETEFNSKFKFYMTTKLANPHYLPEVCNKITLINFTVTTKGLEDQLLGDVVRQLKQEWEEEKDRLVLSVAEDTKMLKDLEDQILNSLSSVGDQNILDNQKIIKTLDDSKFMANVIVERVTKAAETEKKINEAREEYRSVATRGSILYFVMADLAKIDPMYQYSLEYFKKLFNSVILKKNQSASEHMETKELLEMLIDAITISVYNNVCRGLFEKDKHIFSFLTCIQIMMHQEKLTQSEFSFLLRGAPLIDPPEKNISWIEERSWGLLAAVDKYFVPGIIEHVSSHPEEWKKYRDAQQPFTEELPGSWENVSSFQKLLILKCFREEKIMYASKLFIEENLGEQFTRVPPLDLKKAMEDTSHETPIIFILSQGADPVDNLKRFADKVGYGDRLHMKSLGQGQEESAKRYIERGVKTGDWVLLQNCHLSVSFMPELEREIAKFATRGVHEDFRLFLTSMPSDAFPIPILQNGVKLTTEAPKGLRANLAQTWTNMDREYFESFKDNPQKDLPFRKLLFGLTTFHAILQERKKYGPLGWTITYEFNEADLHVAKMWLKIFLDENDDIPWESLKYVIGEIVYGGRVTDPWDDRLILDILYKYFTPEILKPDYKIGNDPIYQIPQEGDLETYQEYVEKLPVIDTPDLFSMHLNADIVFQQQETNKLIDTIIQTQRGSSKGGSKGDSDAAIREKVRKILDDMPTLLDEEEAGPTTFVRLENGVMHSLSTVLMHEMERFNKLLSVIRKSLNELLKAMDGLVVLSSELEKMYECLMLNEVPQMWEDAAYPSLKPLDTWIQDLIERVAFMRDWLQNGPPKVFWISGFFFPQGLMTGVLQTYARKHHVAIDSLDFKFEVLTLSKEEIEAGPEDGIYVSGMFLDGAKWDYDNHKLTECDFGEIRSELPIVHFLPEQNHEVSSEVYQAPLYKTSVRKGILSSMGQSTNFIVAVELPCDREPSFFTLMGSACLCQED